MDKNTIQQQTWCHSERENVHFIGAYIRFMLLQVNNCIACTSMGKNFACFVGNS